MSTDGVDLKKRRFLTLATTAVGAVGAGFVAVPFIASMQPSARARAAGAPVEADISKLEPGQLMRVEWRGKPVWIVRRTAEALETLAKLESKLADPASDESAQPQNAKNAHRSIKEEYFIAVGICTHLGCSPSFVPDPGGDLGSDWLGGFFCPCHGSRFDIAGRVYAGVPAPLNLEVPPHTYISDSRIVIGDVGGAA
ncbi:MAG TPA: ubiquinol-cytochrome c reductase iron-sulfur subunit [Chromatiaceae bacterium]|jgi:ubiquinol-cytochrome c reductase iron-sulfur subunit|nr:ubiquinol-cytochrome c reductase iron-sulfur subunit [Chromatiaceae bacterium]HIB83345.1 ubiquinol-cytochrome c reductase iron-sulfur subunit [Chromatiaceae bacterium]HIN82172.1 ubiquinol-cytochrome c reductase iron-sulfur subunit [Chromatiales bacterium]HIO15026.1 ubiquinol-cytochrome c reductase iron-sulfur subunit [Chromatiales bacterium]HIO54374.1 ubiquinol-cytochrome c reductase iron-sulfur subunit [Chromatiales bacterium]